MTTDLNTAMEREAFEAACVKRWRGDRGGLQRDGKDEYHLGPVQFAWELWQARALVKSQPLTPDQIQKALAKAAWPFAVHLTPDVQVHFARAIEAGHNIKEPS